MQTDLPLPNRRSGKVRDLYDIKLPDGSDGLLMVATDRVSAFDVVMPNGVPGKGILLTQIAAFWFDYFARTLGLRHHLVSLNADDIVALDVAQRQRLHGRVMLCRKLQMLPVECVARGYIAGSGWQDYQRSGTVCGVNMPPGLQPGDALSEPVFTPATKACDGHDENITFEQAAERVGSMSLMDQLREGTLSLYQHARERLAGQGLLLADTKFEFGLLPDCDEPVLADEVLTPDSSRIWLRESWQPGNPPAGFDKQPLRDYLQQIADAGQWDKKSPAPVLPDAVVSDVLHRYRRACTLLTGRHL